jgi:hypothetical protein
MPLSMTCAGTGYLDQRFAVIAYPIATDMAFNGKHAGRVVQLLADVFTDTFQCAATWAVGVVRFVMDRRAWKLCRQRSALGCFFLTSDNIFMDCLIR